MVKYYFILSRMALIKKVIKSIGKDVEKSAPSFIGGNVRWFRPLLKTVGSNTNC